MKVKIIVSDFVVPMGTILDVGNAPPSSWAGKWVKVNPLDHDADGKKGGAVTNVRK